MLLGTRMTNNEPSAITDLDVVARYDATDPNYVVKDSLNKISALLDKSKRLALGNETIINGDFSQGSANWVIDPPLVISNGKVVCDGTQTSTKYVYGQTLPASKVVRYSITISDYQRGAIRLRFGNSATASYITKFISGNGIFTGYGHVMPSPSNSPFFIELNSTFKGSIDNVSIKEVLGNHITQTDTDKMPIHTNRYNLFTYSEDFSNAVWTKTTNILIPNATLSPIGTNNATKVIPNTGEQAHRLNTVIPDVETRSISLYAKSAGYNYVLIADDGYSSFRAIIVDLTNGTVTRNPSNVLINVVNVNNGWYRIEINNTKKNINEINLSLSIVPFYKSTTDLDYGYDIFTGDGISGIFLWGVQCEQNNVVGKYQRINAANDYDTNGFEYYAQFDGVDDYLKSLPFTLNQPTSVYSCLKQERWKPDGCIFDGIFNYSMSLLQEYDTPLIHLFAGENFPNNSNLHIGRTSNIVAIFNGLNSKTKVNNTLELVGSAGERDGGGFTLGSISYGTFGYSNISVKEIIIKRIATDESDTIFNYFKNKHNVQY